jgi:hypothetical protein
MCSRCFGLRCCRTYVPGQHGKTPSLDACIAYPHTQLGLASVCGNCCSRTEARAASSLRLYPHLLTKFCVKRRDPRHQNCVLELAANPSALVWVTLQWRASALVCASIFGN